MNSMAALSKRERQIMDIVFRLGEATAQQVTEELPEGTSGDSIRKLMKILADKGYLEFERQGYSYCYRPVVDRDEAQRASMRGVIRNYFQDSASQAVATILNISRDSISKEELQDIQKMIEAAEQEGQRDD